MTRDELREAMIAALGHPEHRTVWVPDTTASDDRKRPASIAEIVDLLLPIVEIPARQTWVIDVCRTCGRLAQWPFCGHRDDGPATQPWTRSVVVAEVPPTATRET